MENKGSSGGVNPSREFELVHLAGTVWRWKSLVALCMLAAICVALGYLKITPPLYSASTRLLVQVRNPLAEKATRARYEPSLVATQAEILTSRKVVGLALKALRPNTPLTEDYLLGILKRLRAVPVEGTDVLHVSFTSENPGEAVALLKSLVEAHQRYLRDSDQGSQQQSLALLTKTEADIRRQLEEKQTVFAKLRAGSNLVGIGPEAGRIQTDFLSNLGKALAEAKSRRLQLENRTNAWNDSGAPLADQDLVSFPTASFGQRTDLPSRDTFILPTTEHRSAQVSAIRGVQEQVHASKQWETELDNHYGDRHPELAAARSRSKSLEDRLERMIAALGQALRADSDVLRNYETELEDLYDRELKRARQLDLQQLEEQQVLESIRRLRTVHDSILSELHTRQLAAASAVAAGVIHIESLAEPSVTGDPVWPIRSLVLIVFAAVGICGGCGGAVGMERLVGKRRLRDGLTRTTSPELINDRGT